MGAKASRRQDTDTTSRIHGSGRAPRQAGHSAAVLIAALLACSGSGGPPLEREPATPVDAVQPDARTPVRAPTASIERMERMLAINPRYPNLRLDLAQAYLRTAQQSLQLGDQPRYLRSLASAQQHLLDQVEAEPRDSAAHNLLAILSAYAGDLDDSRLSFRIAERLNRSDPAPNLNLAEVSVYQDRIPEARRWLRQARERGAKPGECSVVESLIAWKQRDLVEARARFQRALELDSGEVRSWNGAQSLESFEDLAAYCCQLLFCGPYMAEACGDMRQAVANQERAEETLLEELRLQMERARRLREVYERRRELEIRVDDLAAPIEDASAPTAPTSRASTPHSPTPHAPEVSPARELPDSEPDSEPESEPAPRH